MSKYKNWWGPLRNGLVNDPQAKHCNQMGPAIWLFIYFICQADSQTGQVNPTNYIEISKKTGQSIRKLRRWKHVLEKHGYIKTKRHQHGFTVQITNWRPVTKCAAGGTKNSQSEGARVAINGQNYDHKRSPLDPDLKGTTSIKTNSSNVRMSKNEISLKETKETNLLSKAGDSFSTEVGKEFDHEWFI